MRVVCLIERFHYFVFYDTFVLEKSV